jgi:hypothetical protein
MKSYELLQLSPLTVFYTPGVVNPGNCGQLPNFPGSPPIRIHCECEGVGPSRMKSWCHPGGETPALGGAVMVQVAVEATQVTAGNMVLAPMVLPWVLETAESKEVNAEKQENEL